MKIRKFELVNKNGERYDLTERDFFFHSPKGLGYDRDAKYISVGNTFRQSGERFKQPNLTGKLRFDNPGAYEKYYAFIRFAERTPLRLEYTPNEKTYYLDCIIDSISKSEIENGGLNCDISFRALSFYYELISLTRNDENADGKRYNYTYNYAYPNVIIGTVALNVDSSMESPVVITIYGPCTNPQWNHYLNNQLLETGKCNATLPAGRNLVIDTTQVPYSIKECDSFGNEIYDRYQDSDFSTDRFFFLQNGKNRISVSSDGAEQPDLKVEAHLLYETV